MPLETSIKLARAEPCVTVKWMGLYPSDIQAPGCQLLKRKSLFFSMEKDIGILQQLKGKWGHTREGVRSAGTNLTMARLLNEM